MPRVFYRVLTVSLFALVYVVVGPVAGQDPWVVYDGSETRQERGQEMSGSGKHIVFVTGDDEYRSEEGMPQLAKILAVRHGFRCTVLFAIDPEDGTIKPDHQTNIPGTHQLEDADLMVLFTRFRHLPDDQMKPIIDFAKSGKPMIGLRTSTHAFNYKNDQSPYAKYSWKSPDPPGGFGQLVFGETWVNHHGHHGKESTRGVINQEQADHVIVNGCGDIWGPTDVYGVNKLTENDKVLVWGQVLEGMSPDDKPVRGDKNDPMMPVAWVREYRGEAGNVSKVFVTTMGASKDLESEGLRRLLVNACLWSLDLPGPERADVSIVGEYQPTHFGDGAHVPGLKPADLGL